MKRTFIAAMMLLCGIGASSAQTLGVYQPNSSKMWDFSTLKDQSLPLNNGKLMVGDAQYSVSDVDSVVVRALEAPQLTAAQQQLVKGYQEKLGIDLTKVLGVKKLHARLFFPGYERMQAFTQPYERNLEDYTIITLSEQSTPEKPVLKMTYNPLGLTNYQRYLLYQLTVGNDEFWYGEDAGEDYKKVMEILNWHKNSFGDFNVALDGLTFSNVNAGVNASVNFIANQKDAYGDPTRRIPFQYYFSTWDKAQQIVKEQTLERWEELAEITNDGKDGTPDPLHYLNTSSSEKNEYDEAENFVAPKASVDFKTGKLHFEFSFDAGGMGYTRCYVDYE